MKVVEVEGSRCVTTGDMCGYLGVLVSVDHLRLLGIEPHAKVKNATYWRVDQIPHVIDKLINHLRDLRDI